ncbi:DUF1493 family protein [Cronobacter dublinensis]|uniref:DUF1493 family protein n=1 Tax=Cronobacter dublinensis TaxID=413497 RepID=UPI003F693D72
MEREIFYFRKTLGAGFRHVPDNGRTSLVVETGEEIMEDYFSRFNVDKAGFSLLKYWPVEPGWIPNVLLPASMRIKRVAPAPLTLRMLAESAKAGRWLYE